jgi:hypothetical protein
VSRSSPFFDVKWSGGGLVALGVVAESFARAAVAMEKTIFKLCYLSGWSREDVLSELRAWPGSLSELSLYYHCWSKFPSEGRNG